MKILVFVKAVPTEDGGTAMNYDDKNMLELALAAKDANEQVQIDLICFGSEGAKRILREGLAAGADRACLILQDRRTVIPRGEAAQTGESAFWIGPEQSAEVLVKGLSLWNDPADYQLFLCGYQSEDCRAGAVGPMAAELLGVPHISLVKEFIAEENRVTALRDLSWGTEYTEARLPCLLSGVQGTERLRGATFMGIQEALEKELTVISEKAAGTEQKSVQILSALTNQNRKREIAKFEENDKEIRDAILFNLKLNCHRK